MRLVYSFFARLKNGQIKNAFYLTYYYLYLFYFDFINGKRFAFSNPPEETGVPNGGTGNFPAHPLLVRKLLNQLSVEKTSAVIDVGHGSGIVLFVAHQLGFTDLSGIEYGEVPYNQSKINVGNIATLFQGDAMQHSLEKYATIFFFSPFRGEMCAQYFRSIPVNSECIVAVNVDELAEPILLEKNYKVIFQYQHPIYQNFNAKIWKL
jgi:hypothetical protein